MQRYPRNEQSRGDALIGPGHIAQHAPRNEKARRDELARNGQAQCTVAVTGTGAACVEADIVTGGKTIILTITGNDTFLPDIITRLPTTVMAIFPATDGLRAGLTAAAADFALSGDNKILTCTLPAIGGYSVGAGDQSYDLTLDATLFRNRAAGLVKTAGMVVTGS